MFDLPCLLFNTDAKLFGEQNFRKHLPEDSDDYNITQRFFHSMKSGDLKSFRRFCVASFDGEDDSGNYIIYPLVKQKWLPFRYVFCEKIVRNSEHLTAVFFARKMNEFHPLMSPASPICRNVTGKLIYDMFHLQMDGSSLQLTPETLLLFGEFPLISGAASNLKEHSDQFCDIYKLTRMTFDALAQTPPFKNTIFDLTLSENNQSINRPKNQLIVSCPVEAYLYFTTILSYLLNCLSADHRISADVSYFAQGVEVTYSLTPIHEPLLLGGFSNAEDLFPHDGSLRSLAQLSSAISHLFDLRADFAYNPIDRSLNAYVGIGFDSYIAPKFHYSDPYAMIPGVLTEVMKLIASSSVYSK